MVPGLVTSPEQLDRLDISIIRELTQAQSILPARPGVKPSYREVARKIHASPGTVRNRIYSMYSDGVVKGSTVYVNPNLLGLSVGAFAADVSASESKQAVVERLKLVEGVLFIQDFHGTLVGIAFVCEDLRAIQKRLSLFKSIIGGDNGLFSRVPYPPCPTDLTKREWGLVARLSRGSFDTFASLARELGVTTVTLRRGIAKLVASRAILSVPTMDYQSIRGSVPADAIVRYTTPQARREAEGKVLQLVSDSLIYAGIWDEFGMYSMVLPNLASVKVLGSAIRKFSGVESARVELVDEHIDIASGLGEYVERRLGGSRKTEGQAQAAELRGF
jgi:DNA-binding Lrp family transcriptional regulator